jgi:hypothetical protein
MNPQAPESPARQSAKTGFVETARQACPAESLRTLQEPLAA